MHLFVCFPCFYLTVASKRCSLFSVFYFKFLCRINVKHHSLTRLSKLAPFCKAIIISSKNQTQLPKCKMQENKKNQVLSAFRPFYQLLFIHSSDQFYGKDHQTKTYNLLRSFCFTLLLFSLILSILLGFWYCVRSKEDLKEIALPMSMTICCLQIISIYFAIAKKKFKTCAAIEALQQIVNERKLVRPTCFRHIFLVV